MMYSIKSLVDANTLQTRAKRVLLSVCRVQLSIMQILCKRVQREFTLCLPSAAKFLQILCKRVQREFTLCLPSAAKFLQI